MKTFFGIVMWMELTSHRVLHRIEVNNFNIILKVRIMTRNLFEILLRTFCFNNADRTKIDKIYKKRGLGELMEEFKILNRPAENMYINKSMVPFVGRLTFR